jgi:hypothetical protein
MRWLWYVDREGKSRQVKESFTDRAEPDAFRREAAGRCAFGLGDLVRVARLVECLELIAGCIELPVAKLCAVWLQHGRRGTIPLYELQNADAPGARNGSGANKLRAAPGNASVRQRLFYYAASTAFQMAGAPLPFRG